MQARADLPPVEHFNIDENGVRILDRTIANGGSSGRIIDVYFRHDEVWREYCESKDCCDVKFALSIPEVRKILRASFGRIINSFALKYHLLPTIRTKKP